MVHGLDFGFGFGFGFGRRPPPAGDFPPNKWPREASRHQYLAGKTNLSVSRQIISATCQGI